jgi:hypothetical protein
VGPPVVGFGWLVAGANLTNIFLSRQMIPFLNQRFRRFIYFLLEKTSQNLHRLIKK